jgi:SAM-dependent methyltransferase
VHVDDGTEEFLPAAHFFRTIGDLSFLEETAVSLCRGRVIDLGAGVGTHALALQDRGLEVCAVDVSPLAVGIMQSRGVRDPRLGNLFDFDGGDFDTVLMMMNGIGAVGDLVGLDRFLKYAHGMIGAGGQILTDSTDFGRSTDVAERMGMQKRRDEGRYPGEVRFRMEYRGRSGSTFPWLFVTPETLGEHAARAGWISQVVYEDDNGEYLARLVVG